jgi:hypothetical protein
VIDPDRLISAPVNQGVPLGRELGAFHFDGDAFHADVTASISFHPNPRLVLEGSFQTDNHPLELMG